MDETCPLCTGGKGGGGLRRAAPPWLTRGAGRGAQEGSEAWKEAARNVPIPDEYYEKRQRPNPPLSGSFLPALSALLPPQSTPSSSCNASFFLSDPVPFKHPASFFLSDPVPFKHPAGMHALRAADPAALFALAREGDAAGIEAELNAVRAPLRAPPPPLPPVQSGHVLSIPPY